MITRRLEQPSYDSSMNRFVVLLLTISVLCSAQTLADPTSVGIDSDRLARVPARLKEFADSGSASGFVALVARRGKVVLHEAVGLRDVEAGQGMGTDALFQIASMTKPITATAVMILAEEGRLSVADTVQRHLPEFRGQRMITARDSDSVTLGPPPRLITIRDLLTHTSGMAGSAPALSEIFTTRDRTLTEAVLVYSQQPLRFEPGTRWMYSNLGIATLGRIVEVTSGLRFEDFLEQRIFRPLGMKDTTFFPKPEVYSRIAPVYASEDGKLTRAPIPLERRGAKYPAPEGGLYSTAADLFRFYQMTLNGGVLGGVRIVSPGTVGLMTTLHTGELKAGFAPAWVSDSAGPSFVTRRASSEVTQSAPGATAALGEPMLSSIHTKS